MIEEWHGVWGIVGLVTSLLSRCAASTRKSNSGSVNTGSYDVTVQAIPISDLQTLPMLC